MFIVKLMASRALLHLAFCLAFVTVFSVSLIVSGNHDVAVAAMVS